MVYQVFNPSGKSPIVFICEHASNVIPDEYDNLGLDPVRLAEHIAYDIGAGAVATGLAKNLDAPAVLATFSRLLIDPNRMAIHSCFIPEVSDGVTIPGNQNLSDEEIDKRFNHYHQGYHAGVTGVIDDIIAKGQTPLIVGIHSFTPDMGCEDRPWPISIMWNKDKRISNMLVEELESHGHHVGKNEPYTGKELFYTMDHHGEQRGLPHAIIEIRQDQISDQEGIDQWIKTLTPLIHSALIEHT